MGVGGERGMEAICGCGWREYIWNRQELFKTKGTKTKLSLPGSPVSPLPEAPSSHPHAHTWFESSSLFHTAHSI